jgi:hypothetical protein
LNYYTSRTEFSTGVIAAYLREQWQKQSTRILETEVPWLFFGFYAFFRSSFFASLGLIPFVRVILFLTFVILIMGISLVIVFMRFHFSMVVITMLFAVMIIIVSVVVPVQSFGLVQTMRFTTGVNQSSEGEKK